MDGMKAGDILAYRCVGVRNVEPDELYAGCGASVARWSGTRSSNHQYPILTPLSIFDVIVARGGVEGAVKRVLDLHYRECNDWSEYRAAILGPEDPPEWAVEATKEVLRGAADGCDPSPEYIKDQARIIAKHAPKHDG